MRVYSVSTTQVGVSTAKAMISVFPNQGPALILRAWISQVGLTASEMLSAKLQRIDDEGTGTVVTPLTLNPGDAVSSAVARVNHTVDPTVSVTPIVEEAFNVLNGWVWVPMPEERPWSKGFGNQGVGLFLSTAPSAATKIYAGVIFGILSSD